MMFKKLLLSMILLLSMLTAQADQQFIVSCKQYAFPVSAGGYCCQFGTAPPMLSSAPCTPPRKAVQDSRCITMNEDPGAHITCQWK